MPSSSVCWWRLSFLLLVRYQERQEGAGVMNQPFPLWERTYGWGCVFFYCRIWFQLCLFFFLSLTKHNMVWLLFCLVTWRLVLLLYYINKSNRVISPKISIPGDHQDVWCWSEISLICFLWNLASCIHCVLIFTLLSLVFTYLKVFKLVSKIVSLPSVKGRVGNSLQKHFLLYSMECS